MAEEPIPSSGSSSSGTPETPAAASSSTKRSRDKKPLPLLSRSKLRPPRDLPVSSELSEGTPGRGLPVKYKKETALWVKIVGRVLTYAAIVGLGYGTYQTFRQTQVQGVLFAPGYQLPTDVLLVTDFTDDLKNLRQEFEMARQPYRDEIKTKQAALTQIQSDLTALEERERLINSEIETAKTDISKVIAKGETDALKVWSDNAKPMEDEYNKRLADFENMIKDRATVLGLNYQDDPSVQSPEVWVNAFRLALYSPPKGVKAGDELAWAEGELKKWRDFEKDQETQKQALKAQADAIHKAIAPKIAESDDQVKHLQTRISETEEEAKPIRDEEVVVTGQLNEAKGLLEDENKKYSSQLTQIPIRNVVDKIPLQSKGRWQMRDLDLNSKYVPGGNYLMWLTLKKNGEEYWALVPFSPVQYQALKIVVTDKAFIKARLLLE